MLQLKSWKPPGYLASYGPVCLLYTLGKLLERTVHNRVSPFTEGDHGLAQMQFEFRKKRSTVDAIRTVLERVEKVSKQRRRRDRFCTVVTIGVKNAFKSVICESIATALHEMRVPDYLCRILKSYFKNRVLVCETKTRQRRMQVTIGVPQVQASFEMFGPC